MEQNASKALQFIRDRGVKLTNIGKSRLLCSYEIRLISKVPRISLMAI